MKKISNNNAMVKGLSIFLFLLFPALSHAQGTAAEISSMQSVLDKVYTDMLPMCSRLIDVARGMAGFAALWYIAARVWRQIAAAEPIDFYPLLRPFTLGLVIIAFPSVINLMNGVLAPTVSGTKIMVDDTNSSIAVLLKAKENMIKKSKFYKMYIGDDGKGNSNQWYAYTHPDDKSRDNEDMIDGIGNDIKFWLDKQMYNMRNSMKQWMSQVLEVLYEAASLCINTLRTFILLVLAIVGPLVVGFSVFDGFQNSLTQYLARYVNTFLWLPVANIFAAIIGKIQVNMLRIDITQIANDSDTTFNSTDSAYLVFLVIGIVGYFCVPTVAGFIVQAHGGNSMMSRVTSMLVNTTSTTMSFANGSQPGIPRNGGGAFAFPVNFKGGGSNQNNSGGYMSDRLHGR